VDAHQHCQEICHLTHLAYNHNQATAVANALGTTLKHKLGEIIWRGFTKPYKQNQEASYNWDLDNNKHVTQEEQLVVDTWKNDQLANREIKNLRQEECLVSGTALEVNALQA